MRIVDEQQIDARARLVVGPLRSESQVIAGVHKRSLHRDDLVSRLPAICEHLDCEPGDLLNYVPSLRKRI